MGDRFSFEQSVTLSENKPAHSAVVTCLDELNKIACVCKIYKTDALRAQKRYKNVDGRMVTVTAADGLMNQVSILSGLEHTNIVPLLSVEETRDELKLFFPFYSDCLMTPQSDLTYSTQLPGLKSPETLARLASQISAALQYIHSLGVSHRDVKPDNILMSHRGVFLLSDFGSARKYDGLTAESPATLAFFPPEVCGDDPGEHDPQKADLWALGVTVLSCAIGRLPYKVADPGDMFSLLSAIERTEWSEACEQVPGEVKIVTNSLLNLDPIARRFVG